MTKADFHAFMTDPKTPAKLDMMLADCAEVDRQQAEEDRRRKVDLMRTQFGYSIGDPRR